MGTTLSITVGAMQAFVCVGAIPAGIGFVTDPTGHALGMTVDVLARSPFVDFTVPGLVLLGIHGVGSLLGAVMTLSRTRYAGEAAVLLGSLLVGWMVVQLVLTGLLSPLQPLMLWIGMAEIGFGMALREDLITARRTS